MVLFSRVNIKSISNNIDLQLAWPRQEEPAPPLACAGISSKSPASELGHSSAQQTEETPQERRFWDLQLSPITWEALLGRQGQAGNSEPQFPHLQSGHRPSTSRDIAKISTKINTSTLGT